MLIILLVTQELHLLYLVKLTKLTMEKLNEDSNAIIYMAEVIQKVLSIEAMAEVSLINQARIIAKLEGLNPLELMSGIYDRVKVVEQRLYNELPIGITTTKIKSKSTKCIPVCKHFVLLIALN